MKKITFFIVLAGIFAACDNAPKFHIEGRLTEAKDKMLYLEALTLEGVKTIDSTRLSDKGDFRFSADAPTDAPDFFNLVCDGKRICFAVDSTETLTFDGNLTKLEEGYEIEGNESSKKIREISAMQRKIQSQLIAIEENENLLPGDMVDSVNNIVERYRETIKQQYIFQNPASAYAYYAVCQSLTDKRGTFYLFNPQGDRKDVRCYATVATAWDGNYPDAPRTIQLCNAVIKGVNNTSEPQQRVLEVADSLVTETGIINVELPDAAGKTHSLKRLKGKVVMLDFTTYAAKESPERTRRMRSLYERYSAQGFEIYQVSLDDDTHFWQSSSEHLPWICVHETDGTATRMYRVSAVPTFFLINRDNEIVVRSELMEGTLEENIQKLLGK